MARPPPPTLGQLGETRAVAALRRLLDRPHGNEIAVGNGDDALVWQPQGRVVATVDSVVAGVDWLPKLTPPKAIGHRAAAVNLSDLAAMGAQPRVLLLAVEAPADLPSDILMGAAQGLAALCDQHGCAVRGGDFGLSPGPLRLTVTALGEIDGPALLRSVAKPADRLWLVGEVGRAAAGLQWLQRHGQLPPPDHWAFALAQAHLWPQPQLAAGAALQKLAALGHRIGCIDVSDGLCADAARLAAASRCGAHLDLPLPAWCAKVPDGEGSAQQLADLCGNGGDDYALLVSAPADLDLAAALDGVAGAARCGQMTVGPAGKVFASVGGQVVAGKGFFHGGAAGG